MSNIGKDKAQKIWKLHFKDQINAIDFAGRNISYSQYGNRDSSVGWEIDHALAIANDGKDFPENLMPTHWESNADKANHNRFKTFGKSFVMYEDKGNEPKIRYYKEDRNGTHVERARTKSSK